MKPDQSFCSHINECIPHFHMLFDASQIGLIIADANGILIYYNDAQAQIDELKKESVIGSFMCDVYDFTPEHSPAMTVLRTGKAIEDSVHYYRTRRGKLVNASCAIYPLYSGTKIVGVVCYTQSYSTHEAHMRNIQKALETLKTLPATPTRNGGSGGEETHYTFASLIGNNRALREAVELARRATKNSSSIMLVGETGVGKEIFAQALHYESSRRKYPYTAINCSAVPEALLEGILFGTTRGAFTGAIDKPGLFEVSQNGTIFLDEVDSMPISLQNKLLRVLQENRVRRIGEAYERKIDVRIISSIGKNPIALVNQGLLRPDFYYRIGVVRIAIPPLRERTDDLPLLFRHFLRKHCERLGRPVPLPAEGVTRLLLAHDWPGNVRELEHAVEAGLHILGEGRRLEPEHLRRACPDMAGPAGNAEREALRDMAEAADGNGSRKPEGTRPKGDHPEETGWRESTLPETRRRMEEIALRRALGKAAGNRALAARLLGISPQLLGYKLKKYALDPADFTPRTL